jgi:(methylthio)acryloyl-CoA hydratase
VAFTHPLLHFEQRGAVGLLRLARPEKRNAINVPLVEGLGAFFRAVPEGVRAVVLDGSGEHFSAGLDLTELEEGTAFDAVLHSRRWHEIFRHIEFGTVPVVVAMHGAVVGGGLELACAGHVRVADATAYYGLPEGQRGIFVGGGGSVRIARIIGAHRMADLMLTGRVLTAAEGQSLGISTYLEPAGGALVRATELAESMAKNSTITNFAILQALPRIAQAPEESGYLMESLVSAIASDSPEAKARLRAFLEKRAGKVAPK